MCTVKRDMSRNACIYENGKSHQIRQADCTLRNLTKIHQNHQIHFEADFP